MFKPGDCFRIVSGKYEDGTDKFHPFVVVTEFDEETGDAIMVSFSSTWNKPKYDHTLIIQAGSHEFITEESYAAFYIANRMSQAMLEKKIKDNLAHQGKTISDKILEALRAGVKKGGSKETPKPIQQFYEDCLYRRMKTKTPS